MSEYDESVTDKILSVYELVEIGDFLDDDDVRKTLVKVVNIVQDPKMSSDRATALMVRLQALAFKFKMQGKHYMFKGKKGPEESMKKNYYLSLAEETDKLVSVLKYIIKVY